MVVVLASCADRTGVVPLPPDTSGWDDGPVEGLATAWSFHAVGDPGPLDLACALADDPEEVHHVSGDGDEHVLYGLLADATYDCLRLVGREPERRSFHTGPLPADLPTLTTTGSAPDRGYTLFNHGYRGQQLVLVDADGRIRWYLGVHGDGARQDLDVSWLGDGRFLFGGAFDVAPTVVDLAGALLFVGPPVASTGGAWHHHVEALAGGGVVALAVATDTAADQAWDGATVELLDAELATTTSIWTTQRAVDEGWLPVPASDDDPYHANAVVLTDDRLYVGLQQRSELVALDRPSGALRWRLGPDGDFTLVDGGPEAWFYHPHAFELDGDRVLLFDNGVGRPGGSTSRVVELELDEDALTARVTWEWTEPGFYEVALGDVDRLPSGRVLVTRGHCESCDRSIDGRTEILEVDPATDEVVWRLAMSRPGDSSYRAERIDACGIFANAKYCGGR